MERTKTTLYFDGYKLGKSQKFFLVIAALTYAFDMMDMALFQIVSPILTSNYGITNETLATLNFLFFIGCFLGALLGGTIADKIGRKKTLLINIVIFSLASLANALWRTEYVAVLELSRFFTGFGTMAAFSVAIAYISEMLPSEKRGKYQAITVACGTFSVPFVSVLAATVAVNSAESWRNVFFIGSVMILLVPLAVIFLQESPRWLISKGRVAEAERVMEKCLGIPCDMSEAYENYQKSIAGYQKISFAEQLKIMFAPNQRKQTLTCIGFAVFLGLGNQFLSGYNTVFLTQIGFTMSVVLIAQALSTFGQPVGEFICSIFSDKGGRTTPILIYCSVAGVMFILMGMAPNAIVYAIFSFIRILFSAGALALLTTYIPESFPSSVRGTATGLAYSAQRLSVAFVSLAAVGIFETTGWFGVNFVNALFWFAAGIIVFKFGKKTALQNIDIMHCEPCQENSTVE